MAGYTIKGADGQEYGPVPLETLGAWIRERRLAPFTEVQVDDQPFQPASEIPELAALLQRRGRPEGVTPLPTDARVQVIEALGEAWRILRGNLGGIVAKMFLFGLMFLTATLPFGLLEQLARTLLQGGGEMTMTFIVEAAQSLFIGILWVGVARVFLRFTDDEPTTLQDAFAGFLMWPRAGLGGLAAFLVRWPLFLFAAPQITTLSEAFQTYSKTQKWPEGVAWQPALQTVGVVMLLLWLVGPLLAFIEFLLADRAALSAVRAIRTSFLLGFRHYISLLLVSLAGLVVSFVGATLVFTVVSLGVALLSVIIMGTQGATAVAPSVSAFVMGPLLMLVWGWNSALSAAVYRQLVPPGATAEPIPPTAAP